LVEINQFVNQQLNHRCSSLETFSLEIGKVHHDRAHCTFLCRMASFDTWRSICSN